MTFVIGCTEAWPHWIVLLHKGPKAKQCCKQYANQNIPGGPLSGPRDFRQHLEGIEKSVHEIFDLFDERERN